MANGTAAALTAAGDVVVWVIVPPSRRIWLPESNPCLLSLNTLHDLMNPSQLLRRDSVPAPKRHRPASTLNALIDSARDVLEGAPMTMTAHTSTSRHAAPTAEQQL